MAALLPRVERAAQAACVDGHAHGPVPLNVGALTVDPTRQQVLLAGRPVALTVTASDLLAHLTRRPGQVLSHETLLREVWGYHPNTPTRTVDSHVTALRRKLGHERIRTAHGAGYSLRDPGTARRACCVGSRPRLHAAGRRS